MSEMNKSAKRNPISRRAVLRGVGVTMALPWMESIPVFGATVAKAEFPQRFAAVFMGCGISPDHWSAEGRGAEMQLSKTLQPLEPVKTKLNVIHGLFNKRSTGQGIHPAQTGAL